MILILQRKWSTYYVNTQINTTWCWMMKFIVLRGVGNGIFFKEFSFWSQCASRNMAFQVQEDTWVNYQEIQSTLLYNRGCPKETVSWTPELVFSSGPMGHIKVHVDFAVRYRFAESKYWPHKCIFTGRYSKWVTRLHLTTHLFKEWWSKMWCCYQVKESPIWPSQICTPLVWNFKYGLLDCSFVLIKVDTCILIFKTVICVVYVDDCIFWGR